MPGAVVKRIAAVLIMGVIGLAPVVGTAPFAGAATDVPIGVVPYLGSRPQPHPGAVRDRSHPRRRPP